MRMTLSVILFSALFAMHLRYSTFAGQDAAEWTEQCHTSSKRYYLSPNQIFKGLYANPNHEGQLLADVWVKIVPRTDTKEGKLEYENDVKELKKRVKGKYRDYSFNLSKMEFKCSSRSYHIEVSTDYDTEGNAIFKWPVSLADMQHEIDVTPGSMAEYIMKPACEKVSKDS